MDACSMKRHRSEGLYCVFVRNEQTSLLLLHADPFRPGLVRMDSLVRGDTHMQTTTTSFTRLGTGIEQQMDQSGTQQDINSIGGGKSVVAPLVFCPCADSAFLLLLCPILLVYLDQHLHV